MDFSHKPHINVIIVKFRKDSYFVYFAIECSRLSSEFNDSKEINEVGQVRLKNLSHDYHFHVRPQPKSTTTGPRNGNSRKGSEKFLFCNLQYPQNSPIVGM